MTNNQEALCGLVMLVAAFAAGRYLTPTKVITETKTVEVVKVVKDVHRETEIVNNPDGTTTTKIVEDDQTNVNKNESSDTTKETIYPTSKVTISALAGLPLSLSGAIIPVYGLAITKPILGPLTVGVWGLSSKEAGVSVGLSL